jgi:hypothetical protein
LALRPRGCRHFDLEHGKRMPVKGGKLDKTYQITMPGDLNAVP